MSSDDDEFRDIASEELRQCLAKVALCSIGGLDRVITGRTHGYGLDRQDLARVRRAMNDIRETVNKAQFVLVNETALRSIGAYFDKDFQRFKKRVTGESGDQAAD